MPGMNPRAGKAVGAVALHACLLALAVIVLVLGLVGSVLGGLALSGSPVGPTAVAALWVVLPLTAGCVLAGILWALAWTCRQLHRLEAWRTGPVAPAADVQAAAAALESGLVAESEAVPMAVVPAVPTAVPAPENDSRGERLEAILEELQELNVNLLLSESQRQLKREQLTRRQTDRLVRQVERALAHGEWRQADQNLDRLQRVAPDFPQLPNLRRQAEGRRSQAEQADLAEATRKAAELMAAGKFVQARAVANDLLTRHPNSQPAIDLLARVGRERSAYVNEQRLRMYRKVEAEAANRQWRAALSAAQELLAAHPDCPEADSVRAQLQTLQENAIIEEARELRDRIRDLLSRRRYADALQAARDAVHRFPATAVAEELRQQMARLEELARSGPVNQP